MNREFAAKSEVRPDIASKLKAITDLHAEAVTVDLGGSPINWKQIGTKAARVIRLDSDSGSLVNMPGAATRRMTANAESTVLPDANTANSYYVFVTYKNANDQFITVANYGGSETGHPVVSGLYNIPGFEGFRPVLSGEFRVEHNVIVSVSNKSGRTNRYSSQILADPELTNKIRELERDALADVFHVDKAVVNVNP